MDIKSSPSVSSIRLEVQTNSLHNLAGKFPEEKERKDSVGIVLLSSPFLSFSSGNFPAKLWRELV